MKCYDWEILSRYQDGSLDEAESRRIDDHLLSCLSCQEKMRSLGRAGLFLRIAITGRRQAECPTNEELGAYLSGRMRLEDRHRVEAHLLICQGCLHEVAVLSDPQMFQRSSASPVPDAAALAQFRRMVVAARRRRVMLRPVFAWGLRAAAAVLLGVMTLGQMWTSPTLEEPVAVVSSGVSELTPIGLADAGYLAEVSLSLHSTLLQPDSTDLVRFARDAGLILREVERAAEQPRTDSFDMVREDILSSGIVDSVVRLKEVTSDRRDRKFLADCEYVLMRAVKLEVRNVGQALRGLVSEIQRLNLIETARLVEMEGGRSQWLAGL